MQIFLVLMMAIDAFSLCMDVVEVMVVRMVPMFDFCLMNCDKKHNIFSLINLVFEQKGML